ncbi:MAG: type I DNA topoisomerase [Thermodesulfobacteriota bacterium]|nr:type I DNA topoisomerase [Thermodesulfobacteriota bacterium]
MNNSARQKTSGAYEIENQFNKILGKHIERLIGTRYGIGGLPLNLTIISSLILLNERDKEIESLPSEAFERYTQETLFNELGEIGLDSDPDMDAWLRDMIRNGYIDLDDNGSFSTGRPTPSMMQLLDHIFPKMPGMNLVAYLIQTIEEVKSGRKDLELAISQFDQTLQMQGIPVKKGKTLKPTVKPKTLVHKKTPSPVSPSRSKILSPDRHPVHKEIKEIHFGKILTGHDKSLETAPELFEEKAEGLDEQGKLEEFYAESEIPAGTLPAPISEPDSEIPDLAYESTSTDITLEDTLSTSEYSPFFEIEEQGADLSGKEKTEREPTESDPLEEAEQFPENIFETENVSEDHVQVNSDQTIEQRISAFEEDLAMQCPMCKSAKVLAEETDIGKTYYRCSDKKCHFISWGKPYHLVCPECNNPFLVETPDREGNTLLKCPRATCRYRKKFPWETTDSPCGKPDLSFQAPAKKSAISRKPHKRVVRKRVVRRKR